MEPVRFARAEEDRALGRVTYFLALLALGVLLGLPAAGLGGWVVRQGRLSAPAAWMIPAACAAGAVGLVGWGLYRSFRRRAYGEIVFGSEHLEMDGPDDRLELPYAEVDVVRRVFDGWEPTLELRAADGRTIRVPSDLVPLERSRPLLEERLLPGLQERIDRVLQTGGTVVLAERSGEVAGLLVQAAGLVLLSVPLLLAPPVLLKGWRTLRDRLASGARGLRGSLRLCRDGLCPPGEPLIPWTALALARSDDSGLVLRRADGRTFQASSLAENVWPVGGLLRSRLPPS